MNQTSQLTKEQMRFLRLLTIGLLLLAHSNLARAQVTASITGRVEDSSGAAVPGAAVAVTSEETGVTRTVTSDESGNYRVLSLPVGRYDIKAEKTGFKAAVQKGINLVVGQEAVVNLGLEVGEVQQQVTVTAEAPLVNTTTASISGLVGEKEVKDLPLNGRSFDQLIDLNPGVANTTAEKGAGAGQQQGNMFSVSGQRWSDNLFLINGVEYTGPTQIHSIPGGVSGQLLGIEAVREFNVLSDTYGAEYGKRSGAQINIVTQSGTNQLHGTVFEFLRNSVLDARNYFDNPPMRRIPPFERNQFGGALGGPVQRDKTFIFGNYEGFRQRLGTSNVAIVPDANARMGILPCGVVTPLPSGCKGTTDTTPLTVPGLQKGMLPYTALWPAPNGPNLGGGVAESFSNPPQSIREDFGTVRVDHTFSNKDQLAGIYTVDDGYNSTPLADPLFAQVVELRSQILSLQETHIFSPNVINTFTAGFSRAGFHYLNIPISSVPSNLTFVEGKPQGRINIGGGGGGNSTSLTLGGGSANTQQLTYRNLFTYQDQIQLVKGRHQITAGAWFQQTQSNEHPGAEGSGEFTFTTLQTFLQGTVQTFLVSPIKTPMNWRQLEGAWYADDNIQLRPNLTVRLGLRHEFTNGMNEANGRAENNVYGPNGVLLTTPVIGNSIYSVNNSKWLFGPRIGIAWDPFGKGKTAIRAGFGTYYDFIDAVGFVLDALPPYNGFVSLSNVPILPLLPINPSTPVPPSCGPGVPNPCTTYAPQLIQSNAKTPTVERWNLTVEQGITPNTSLSLSYVGSHGFHQVAAADPDGIPLQACTNPAGCTSGGLGNATGIVPQGTEYIPVAQRPNPFFGAGGTGFYTFSNSSYNGLLVDFAHRYSSGLQFRADYTWSRDFDIASGVTGGDAKNNPNTMLDRYDPGLDWGLSALNVTNRFVFSGGYELPFGSNKPWLSGLTGAGAKLVNGWQINGIVTAESGLPFDTLTGSNWSGNGDADSPDRPSWNPAFTGPVIEGTPKQWYNPHAFILPIVGTYGNVKRDSLIGPNLRDVDVSIFKTTLVTERISVQFRAEAFNLLNRANFNLLGLNVFSGSNINPSAGRITSTATTSRQLQFGLKLVF